MSKNFVNALKKESNYTLTENGAVALKSTNSALVDLFGQIGAMRKRTDADIESAFSKAFAEDRLLATKMAFYARNIRGGLGERRTARIIFRFLAKLYPDIMKKNMHLIPFFGRYDDLYEFIGTPIEEDMWQLIREQWDLDIDGMKNNKPISLLAKWLKSVNTSSDESNRLGKLTAKNLGLSEKEYRKTLAELRRYLDVAEVKMSHNQWNEINYEGVPSRAMAIYRNAFRRHDEDRFNAYIESVSKGEAKINSSTLFPYDILEKMGLGTWGGSYLTVDNYDKVLEEQWKALPNYIEGENNVLVMADTSGSMRGRPMATSVGLAIYFAERNKGVFKDVFMTFSSRPSFVQLKGNTLYEKIKCIPSIIANTDLEAAFRLILNTAINNNLTAEDMPKSLIVISDMEFDDATYYNTNHETFYESMVKMYRQHGYEMPNIIFWNVDSRHDNFQVASEYRGVQLASGQSPSVFKSILNNIGKTPYEAMLSVLNDPMYDCITV
jgi:hypothetical protein